MRNRFAGTIVVSLLVLLAFASSLPAQWDASAPPPVKPGTGMAHDLSGVWALGKIRERAPVNASPMTTEGQAKFDFNTHEIKENRPITIDPAYTCHWPGLPHIYISGAYAFEFIQTSQRIVIFYENTHQWREIWMDGREIPKDGDSLWMGYSVGHWEGNDLVVDTANFNDKTWLDVRGHSHSDALKLTERYHRPDHDHLQISFTIDDPKMYKSPWVINTKFELKPTWEIGEAIVPEDQEKFFQQSLQEPGGNAAPEK